ncbi:MAG: response regulator [Planctomycetota bacterium]
MTHSPITVLIAEDDPVFRRVMGFSIARSGLTVESVSDGDAAYHRLCQGGVHFLVTDHQMPICSGLELLDRMANTTNREQKWPPVILCTAKGLELDSQALESRYNLIAVMHKPFSPRKLSETILQHIGKPEFTSSSPCLPPLGHDGGFASEPPQVHGDG